MKRFFIYQSNLIEKFNGFKNLNQADLFSLGMLIEVILCHENRNAEELRNIMYDIDTIIQLRQHDPDEKNHTSSYFETKKEIMKLANDNGN